MKEVVLYSKRTMQQEGAVSWKALRVWQSGGGTGAACQREIGRHGIPGSRMQTMACPKKIQLDKSICSIMKYFGKFPSANARCIRQGLSLESNFMMYENGNQIC